MDIAIDGIVAVEFTDCVENLPSHVQSKDATHRINSNIRVEGSGGSTGVKCRNASARNRAAFDCREIPPRIDQTSVRCESLSEIIWLRIPSSGASSGSIERSQTGAADLSVHGCEIASCVDRRADRDKRPHWRVCIRIPSGQRAASRSERGNVVLRSAAPSLIVAPLKPWAYVTFAFKKLAPT